MESKEIEKVGKIISDNISDNLFSILDFIQETKKEEKNPFIFYRKFRFKKKIKRRYMIRVNPVKTLIADNLFFGLKLAKKLFEMEGKKIWKLINLK